MQSINSLVATDDQTRGIMPLAVRFGRSKNLVGVRSLLEARNLWLRVRDEYNLGSSESPMVHVIDTKSMAKVARISYNGRLWDMAGVEIKLA